VGHYPCGVTPPAVIGALLDAFTDLGRVLEGMSDEEALAGGAGSSYAWTVAHLANQVDSWINVRFAGEAPHPLVSADRYRFGGDGRAESWAELRDAAVGVRATAAAYLTSLSEADLERSIPYPGSLPELKDRQVSLRYTLIRVLTHHYFHIGELASKRSAAGHSVGDYPGPLLRTAEADR
jgi:uncharacterized damage-inducible protein DinB